MENVGFEFIPFRYIIIGVASFGDSKAEDCGNHPAGFARIE